MTYLEMAEEIDASEEDVDSWEAEFLENVLPLLRDGKELSPKQKAILEKMHKSYCT